MRATAFVIMSVTFGALCGLVAMAQGQGGAAPTPPASGYVAVRFEKNPIITPRMPGLAGAEGSNINGPSLIRVPQWVDKPLGRYYLYFSHHNGKYIRLAYSDTLSGPWKIHGGGVLTAKDAPGSGHIASPDVHVDEEHKQIRMYFHQPSPPDSGVSGQVSFVALSADGLHFSSRTEVLGSFYFRVFRYRDWHYAFAKNANTDGVIYRSRDGLTGFEAGPHYLPGVRHTAMWVDGDTLYLLYTKVGEAPERIYLGKVDLVRDWMDWKVTDSAAILQPEKDYEGATLPSKPSDYGAVSGPVRQLRDPAVFAEDGLRYLLYSVAGEQGIAIASLKPEVHRGQPRKGVGQ